MKQKKTLSDVEAMSPEDLAKGLETISPFIYDSIKDRLDEIPVNIQEALVQKIQIPRALMLKYKIPFNRHQMRQIALEAIYQNLLVNKDIRKALYDILRGSNEVDGYLYSLAVGTVENKDEYIDLISSKLRKDWSFDRLPVLEQAILLMSCQEILVNETPKPAVINEAITLTKEFCDPESAKMINAILDSLPEEK